MNQSISIVAIAVNDFEKELSFYRDTLGWETFNVVDGTVAFFRVGHFLFELCAYQELVDDVGTALITGPHLGVTFALNLSSESAVDAIFAKLGESGVHIAKKPVRASWGGYSGYFADPEGHLWEVAHNPQFQYGDDGVMVISNSRG